MKVKSNLLYRSVGIFSCGSKPERSSAVNPWLAALVLLLTSGLFAPQAHAQPSEDDAPSAESTDTPPRDRHLGFGLLGLSSAPSAVPLMSDTVSYTPEGNAVVNFSSDDVTVPLVGVRYWLGSRVGAQLGLGLNVVSGSQEQVQPHVDASKSTTVQSDTPSTLAFASRLSLPISVTRFKHLDVLVIPEVDFTYTRRIDSGFDVSDTGSALDLKLSAWHLGAGARLGGEVDFGFVGAPNLSLQSAWGLRFEHRVRSAQIGDAQTTRTEGGLSTDRNDSPWDLFFGGLSVLYYVH